MNWCGRTWYARGKGKWEWLRTGVAGGLTHVVDCCKYVNKVARRKWRRVIQGKWRKVKAPPIMTIWCKHEVIACAEDPKVLTRTAKRKSPKLCKSFLLTWLHNGAGGNWAQEKYNTRSTSTKLRRKIIDSLWGVTMEKKERERKIRDLTTNMTNKIINESVKTGLIHLAMVRGGGA